MTIPLQLLDVRHGGNLTDATARYGTPPQGWLDLSTGINPMTYPALPIDAASLAALPDCSSLQALVATARAAYGVPAEASLAAAPGSEIVIRLMPLVLPDGHTAIVGPTYGSHYEAWAAARQTVSAIPSVDAIPPDATNVVLANPNNPDGRTLPRADIARLAGALADKGGVLVVDEAYADLLPDISLVPLLDGAPAVVLRSFGKFFGLAGLRLGFVAGPAAIVDRLANLLGAWPVSNAALVIGKTALGDQAWQHDTRKRLSRRTGRLRTILTRHGLRLAGGTDLFVLVEQPAAFRLHERLAMAGIWTRVFPCREDWLRIGLPAGEDQFTTLDAALASAADTIAPAEV